MYSCLCAAKLRVHAHCACARRRVICLWDGYSRYFSAVYAEVAVFVQAIAVDKISVLAHCSDGWDRTSQMSALAMLCMDPHYRTFAGFAQLIEKEWLCSGHKFRDRTWGAKQGEHSPIFLQVRLCTGNAAWHGFSPHETHLANYALHHHRSVCPHSFWTARTS